MNGGICEAIATCPGYICRCGTNFTGIHCEDCNQRGNALGMESHLIPDDAITASSFEPAYQPYSGRLNAKGWIALANDTGNPYFQVRFGQEKIVSKVIIQGVLGDKVDDHACVKTLYFSSSLDGVRWVDNRPRDFSACQVFYGQTELVFAAPIHAKYIRINPTNWFRRPALRIELYGCDPPNNT
ncbi:predicted protein [Nematostella vectensis]|uniref:F5/8 type C domain-containing protein n=2 Tax=Nematostella vectensis TaxID=45351 RepID=A7RNZ1_NEMVE|nr:predicted protein [Nematostella vectensis]|eukprot:XP_001638885.1 predicted protein [Nematostella vectensis]